MPVTAEIGISVNFKAYISVGVKRDSLRSCGLQVIHKVDYRVSVERSRVLGEAGTLMRRVSNI